MPSEPDSKPHLVRTVHDNGGGPPPDAPALPLPFYHHPVIAISLIIIVASFAQIGVWLIHSQLQGATTLFPSSVIVYSKLFDLVATALAYGDNTSLTSGPLIFAVCLILSLLSGIAWYLTARLALGPRWGLWAGLFWVTHPAFAFMAQRPSPLMFLMPAIPLLWLSLLLWKRSPRPAIALLMAMLLGGISLISLQGFILLATVALTMWIWSTRQALRWTGWYLLPLCYAIILAPWFIGLINTESSQFKQAVFRDMWNAMDSGDGSAVARNARLRLAKSPAAKTPCPFGFLAERFVQSPHTTIAWFAKRLFQTLYTTSDTRLRRPMLTLQLFWLMAGLWGFCVASRHVAWRQMARGAVLLAIVPWFTAALAEPLVRNASPVGGIGIMFALVGIADIYERIFGRRLTENADFKSTDAQSRV